MTLHGKKTNALSTPTNGGTKAWVCFAVIPIHYRAGDMACHWSLGH